MNGRMTPAQREAMIRRTVYVSDIDQQARSYTYIWLLYCLNYGLMFICIYVLLYSSLEFDSLCFSYR